MLPLNDKLHMGRSTGAKELQGSTIQQEKTVKMAF